MTTMKIWLLLVSLSHRAFALPSKTGGAGVQNVGLFVDPQMAAAFTPANLGAFKAAYDNAAESAGTAAGALNDAVLGATGFPLGMSSSGFREWLFLQCLPQQDGAGAEYATFAPPWMCKPGGLKKKLAMIFEYEGDMDEDATLERFSARLGVPKTSLKMIVGGGTEAEGRFARALLVENSLRQHSARDLANGKTAEEGMIRRNRSTALLNMPGKFGESALGQLGNRLWARATNLVAGSAGAAGDTLQILTVLFQCPSPEDGSGEEAGSGTPTRNSTLLQLSEEPTEEPGSGEEEESPECAALKEQLEKLAEDLSKASDCLAAKGGGN